MYILPPIGVLAILAVGLASTAWLAPPQREVAPVTVMLPAATHQKLALWARDRADPDRRPLMVVQVIEEFVNKREKNSRAPAKELGEHVRLPLKASDTERYPNEQLRPNRTSKG
jgi:hypothetical protein